MPLKINNNNLTTYNDRIRIMYIFRQFFHYHVYVSLKYEVLSIRHTGYTSWNIVQVASVGT